MRILCCSILFALAALFVLGCGGGKSTVQSGSQSGSQKASQTATNCNEPDWYRTPPEDPNYFFAPATATSQDMQLAVDKATAAGRTEIGRQADVRIQGLQKRFSEETGVGTDAQLLDMFTQASKTVVSTSLTGSRAKYQEHCKDGDIWRAYVLVQYPINGTNQALVQQIKNHEQMYTRFRASQSFKDLEDEVSKYEQYKKEQEGK